VRALYFVILTLGGMFGVFGLVYAARATPDSILFVLGCMAAAVVGMLGVGYMCGKGDL
jgi:hypothetical protein